MRVHLIQAEEFLATLRGFFRKKRWLSPRGAVSGQFLVCNDPHDTCIRKMIRSVNMTNTVFTPKYPFCTKNVYHKTSRLTDKTYVLKRNRAALPPRRTRRGGEARPPASPGARIRDPLPKPRTLPPPRAVCKRIPLSGANHCNKERAMWSSWGALIPPMRAHSTTQGGGPNS